MSGVVQRLGLRTLAQVPPTRRPRVDPASTGVGILHLGIGAFHRAHQAEFTEDAIAAAGGEWGICGVSQRSRSVIDALAPQDGLYTVLTRGSRGSTARVVGAVRELIFAGTDAARVVARLADPAVRVTTLTVTEKGYRHDSATGRLRRDDLGVQADLAGQPPQTVVGQLVRGLQARMAADAGPHAVLSCDNLAHNGATLAGLVRDFVDQLPAEERRPLGDWIDEQVRFPSSMVDRIVPAPTDDDRAEVHRLIGLRDDGAVATESFRQWVIEDDFPGGRPAWERAGALLTGDVTPYELIKLRVLNAAHSTLAYLGALAGCATIAEAIARDEFAAVVHHLWRDDAEPTLAVPAGFDLPAYEQQLLDRFADPALRHSTLQVAMDGSQKLPQRLVSTIVDARRAGRTPQWAMFAVAAWMRWVSTEHTDAGAPRKLDDPLAPTLQRAVAGASTATHVVDRLLAVRAVFGADLAHDDTVRASLVDSLQRIAADGAQTAAHALTAEPTERGIA
ncbi:MAG: fructuronate reductase [Pseudonocardiales bacterium]|nr:fructuronate reductase [Pseudonocardiales bacterium]